MRDLTLSTLGSNNDAALRLSSSCPTLCPLTAAELAPRPGNHHDTGSDPDLLANCSTNSSPTHFPGSAAHSRSQRAQTGIDRRRSWTGDLEDLEESRRGGRRRYSGQNHLQAQNMVNIACYLLEPEVGAGSISVSSRYGAADLDATEGYAVATSSRLASRVNVRNELPCASESASRSELIEIASAWTAVVTKTHSIFACWRRWHGSLWDSFVVVFICICTSPRRSLMSPSRNHNVPVYSVSATTQH